MFSRYKVKDSKKILVYGGWFGSRNTGDEAILLAMLKNIRSCQNSKLMITVFSEDPHFTEKNYGVRALDANLLFSEVFHAYFETDLFVVSGGTPLYDYDHLFRFYRIGLAKILGKPIMFYAISTKNIESQIGRFITRLLVNMADVITVRDSESIRILNDLGITRDILCTADPAITLRAIKERRFIDIFLREGLKPDSTLIGICPRCFSTNYKQLYHSPVSKTTIDNYITSLARTADYLINQGYRIVFIPFHSVPPDNDRDSIAKVLRLMKHHDNTHILNEDYAPTEIIEIISKLKLVIGTRLHSLIFSASTFVPMVAIDYEPKITGFMKSIGQEEFLCKIEEIEPESLILKVQKALSSSKRVRQELRKEIPKLQERAVLNARIVANLVNVKERDNALRRCLRKKIGWLYMLIFGSILLLRKIPNRIYRKIITNLFISKSK